MMGVVPTIDRLKEIVKTYSVTHLSVTEASRRYSPANVVAVGREVVTGLPSQISTSYVERSNLTIRMGNRRFTRLTNGFSKKFENHVHALAIQFMHYNFARPHGSLGGKTPAMASGVSDQ